MTHYLAGQDLGARLLQRMQSRVSARLQVKFLQQLSELPIARYLILGGSGALHGVYLHRRYIQDIDLAGPYAVLQRFADIMDHNEIPVLATGNPSRFLLTSGGAVMPDVRLGIELYPRMDTGAPAVESTFSTSEGDIARVWCHSLPELLLMKCACLHMRVRALDYADLWYGLVSASDIVPQMRHLQHDTPWHGGRFTPPAHLDVETLDRRLLTLESVWRQELRGTFYEIPPFEQVRADLRALIPGLNALPLER